MCVCVSVFVCVSTKYREKPVVDPISYLHCRGLKAMKAIKNEERGKRSRIELQRIKRKSRFCLEKKAICMCIKAHKRYKQTKKSRRKKCGFTKGKEVGAQSR